MAHFALKDAYVEINSVNLSTHVKSVTVNYSSESQDDTTMGATSHSRKGGLKDWSLSVEFAQDFAGSQVDATLFALVGTTFTVEVRPTSASRAPTNPGYQGTGILESYQPISGSVGSLAMAPVTISCANGIALIRATS